MQDYIDRLQKQLDSFEAQKRTIAIDLDKWRNEKNGRLKTSENFATMGVCKGFFKMDCKKALRSAQSVKI